MKPTIEIQPLMDMQLMEERKTPHSSSAPLITKINDEYYLSIFIFFYNYEELVSGMIRRPSLWGIFDFENGNLIEKFQCNEKDFSDASFTVKYDVRPDTEYEVTEEYIELSCTLFDEIRQEYIETKQINLNKYKEYFERIIFDIPKEYRKFYYDLSFDLNKQEENKNDKKEIATLKEEGLKVLTIQEQLEEYIEKNCNRYYISYEEFKATPFFDNAKIYYVAGKKIETNSNWTFQKTMSVFSKEFVSNFIYTTYEQAESLFFIKKCDTDKNYAWRVRQATFITPFASRWIAILFNKKGHCIRIVDTEKVDPNIIKNYYKKQEELVQKDSNKELLTITATNIIDWLCYMEAQMTEKQMEETAENLLKYDDIALAVQHHIEYDEYDDSIFVEGYTAKKLHDEVKDKLAVIGIYNYLITLKENPEQGKKWLEQGLPRK